MTSKKQTRRMNEIKKLLGNDNFDIKYRKVAYWSGQPVIIGKNDLQGFYFELAGAGYIVQGLTCLEDSLGGSRELFNIYFSKLQTLKYYFLRITNRDLEKAFKLMREEEDFLEGYKQ